MDAHHSLCRDAIRVHKKAYEQLAPSRDVIRAVTITSAVNKENLGKIHKAMENCQLEIANILQSETDEEKDEIVQLYIGALNSRFS